jgi:hypothetical protein
MQFPKLRGLFDDSEFDGTEFTYNKFRFPFVMLTTKFTFHLVGHNTTALVQELKRTGWLVFRSLWMTLRLRAKLVSYISKCYLKILFRKTEWMMDVNTST